MLTYNNLEEKPKEFLAATELALAEFEIILLVFRMRYASLFKPELNRKRNPRQRRAGDGVKENLRSNR